MIKFAEVKDGVVVNIIVGDDLFSKSGYIKVTSSTRDAHIGSSYDEINNKFIDIQPWDSWTLDNDTYEWVSPLGAAPTDGVYRWDEDSLSWIKLS